MMTPMFSWYRLLTNNLKGTNELDVTCIPTQKRLSMLVTVLKFFVTV